MDNPEREWSQLPLGFIADIDPTFCQHFLDVSKAQRKAKIEPDCTLDY